MPATVLFRLGRAHPAPVTLRPDQDLAWHSDFAYAKEALICSIALPWIHGDPACIPLGSEEERHLQGGAGRNHVRGRGSHKPEVAGISHEHRRGLGTLVVDG